MCYMHKKKKNYLFIDTAGISKKNKLKNINKIVLEKVFKILKKVDVALLIVDPFIGITKRDLSLLKIVVSNYISLIIAINKYDLISKNHYLKIKRDITHKINFFKSAEIHCISAKNSYGINNLIKSIDRTYKSRISFFKTSQLTRILCQALIKKQLPIVKCKKIKLKYAHIGGYNPLTIVIHGRKTKHLPNNYIIYLKNYFIQQLQLIGIKLKIKFIDK